MTQPSEATVWKWMAGVLCAIILALCGYILDDYVFRVQNLERSDVDQKLILQELRQLTKMNSERVSNVETYLGFREDRLQNK